MIIEITEDGKIFSGYVTDRGECDEWTRVDAVRRFRYKRCQLCGRLVPKHAHHWYSHMEACMKKHKIVSDQ